MTISPRLRLYGVLFMFLLVVSTAAIPTQTSRAQAHSNAWTPTVSSKVRA